MQKSPHQLMEIRTVDVDFLAPVRAWWPDWQSVTLDPHSPHCVMTHRDKVQAKVQAKAKPEEGPPKDRPKVTGHKPSAADPRNHKRSVKSSRRFAFKSGGRAESVYLYLLRHGETSTRELQDHFCWTGEVLWSSIAPARLAGVISRRVDEAGAAHLTAVAL